MVKKRVKRISGIDRLALSKTSGLAAVINAAVMAILWFPDIDFAIRNVIAINKAPVSQKNRREEKGLTPNIL